MSDQRPTERPGSNNNRKPRPSGPTPPPGGLRLGRGLIGWIVLLGLFILLFVWLSRSHNAAKSVPFSQFKAWLQGNDIRSVDIDGAEIYFKTRKPQAALENRDAFVTRAVSDGAIPNEVHKLILDAPAGVEVTYREGTSLFVSLLMTLIPWVLILLLIWFFVFRQLRNAGAGGGMLGNFGRSKHRIQSKEHTSITFEDVAGVQEAKDEVMELVEFLKNPRKFQRLGARIPRGVLLVGEPGTGKTMLAKAIAGEADVPFFSISGSDFVEMFVGVGASRVRDLFKQAKENSPCIIFLDEIDAVGRRRGSGFSSGGHDEREQTLNAILVEMDGFDTNDMVIVCAATNRVDVLDPALTRPGRFDRQVSVPLPDVKGRFEILKVHSRKVKIGPDIDLLRLAKATPGFSGADLAAIINEAALRATLANKDFIEQDDLEESRDKVRWGRAKKSRVVDEKDRLATAYHEAGHAVVQYLEKEYDPIHKVTIIPRGIYGGATMTLPEKDRTNYSRKYCISYMRTLFAGRIAEEMFCGDINTGALGDIRQASGMARRMVREWGMNDRVGFVYYGDDDSKPNAMGGFGEGREYSEETAKAIDEEVKKLIDALYEETRAILMANRDRVEALAKALLKYETLDGPDIERLMKGDSLTRPTVSDLIERESRASSPPQPKPQDPPPALGGLGGPLPSPG